MDVQAYLDRIGYRGALSPSMETLKALHRAHLLAVPFENLDILLGRPIALDEASLFEKIVLRKRGGFCYELNGLFSLLLTMLGFDVTLLSARTVENDKPGPEFDHLVLLVFLETRRLADVGFGDSFLAPLNLDEKKKQVQDDVAYRLVREAELWTFLRRGIDGEWVIRYHFTLEARQLNDFEEMCVYHQTSPDSIFTKKRLISRATPDGRITLSGNTLIHTKCKERNETVLNDNALTSVLSRHFDIEDLN